MKNKIETRAKELSKEWEKKNPFFFTDNGFGFDIDHFRIQAIIELLDSLSLTSKDKKI